MNWVLAPLGYLLLSIGLAVPAAPQDPEYGLFQLHFGAPAFAQIPDGKFSGDVLIVFSHRGEPREQLRARFPGPPVMRFRVEDVPHGGTLTVSVHDAIAAHPLELYEMGQERWNVQAIVSLDPFSRQPGLGSGDIYSEAQRFYYTVESTEVLDLHLDHVSEGVSLRETERVKEFVHRNQSLSEFHGMDYPLKAGVLLPKEHDPERTYPLILQIPSFGGGYHNIGRWAESLPEDSPLHRCIVVIPDPHHRFGHSGFCDSANNGPWGQAFVEELVPALETRFGGAGPDQRYLTGVGSGGWAALWLQVRYPEAFAGCWSHSPDPIDFHEFQQIDLYTPIDAETPRNFLRDSEKQPRPFARVRGKLRVAMEDMVRREAALHPGGQIRSWEANWGPRGENGLPAELFDRTSGRIDHETAKAWRSYDLSHLLLTEWESLRPTLAGKIHLYAGDQDTFLFDSAVRRFRNLAEEHGLLTDMVVEIVPEVAHQQHAAGWEHMLETIAADLEAASEK